MFAGVGVARVSAAAHARNGVIAYAVGNGEEEPYAIMTIRPDGTGNQRLLGPTRHYPSGPAFPVWSKDGRRLLFERFITRDNGPPPAGSTTALWTANPKGRDLRRIPLHLGPVGLWGFDWSPDGRRIVFAAGTFYPHPTIYTISVTGKHRRTLGQGWYPTWSGDGRHIAFMRLITRGIDLGADRDRIGIMRPDGTHVRYLTSGLHDSAPAFSPDGRRLVYVRNFAALGGEQWRVTDVKGKHDGLVRRLSGTSHIRYCPPSWAPDGRRLAAIRTSDGPTDNDPSIAQFTTLRPSGIAERIAFTFPIPYVARYSMCHFSWRPVSP